jgi:hypothetical protein
VTGRLAERIARRVLEARFPGARVVDVSAPAARAAATFPDGYTHHEAGVSPGVDFLVFEEGASEPVGWEV